MKKRGFALLAAVLLAAGLFLASFFLVREVDHDCVGENCPICSCLLQAARTLERLGAPAVDSGGPGTVLLLLIAAALPAAVILFFPSPVDQKIRLDN